MSKIARVFSASKERFIDFEHPPRFDWDPILQQQFVSHGGHHSSLHLYQS